MSESEDEGVEPTRWTNSNLLKLLTSLSETIPEGLDTTNYQKGMKSVDWDKVAFHPFSPEECLKKWTHIMEKMRKLRSLPDLIAEAKTVISDPLLHRNIHPEVPKKPLGPRKVYFMEHHQKFKKKYPHMRTQNIFKLLSKKFEKLPEEKKVMYEKKHASKVLEYQKEMSEFCKQNKLHAKKVRVALPYRSYEKEIPDQPTKPPYNSYTLFCMEYCKGVKGKSKVDALELSRQWKIVSPTEKAAYKNRWIELKRQYALEMKTYLDGLGEEERERLKEKGIQVPKVPKPTAEIREPREPKMPSQSPYSHFMGEQLKLLDKTPSLKECLEIPKRWKDIPPEYKEPYENKVHEETKRYTAKLKKWLTTMEPEQQSKYLKGNPSKSEFLDVNKRTNCDKMTNCDQIKPQFGQTSDSEDEVVNISDEEDSMSSGCEELEDEEEEDIIMFEIN